MRVTFRYLTVFLLLFFVFTGISTSSFSQTNPLEAKAAYLLAEESYGKGDMRAALEYIEEAATKLGAANAKILYLKIMTLKELSAKNAAFNNQLDSAIAAFEKAADIADFNEEKTMEIVKIKLERKRQRNLGNQVEQSILDYQTKTGWVIGMRADSLEKQRPDLFTTQPGKYYVYKTGVSRTMSLLYHYQSPNLQNLTDIITIKDSLISSHAHYYYNYPTETPDFGQSVKAQVAVLDELKNTFGYIPDPELKTTDYDKSTGGSLTNYIYTWPGKELKISLSISHYSPGGKNSSSCVLSLYK